MTTYQTQTFQRGDWTIIVHRPQLTEAERAKREKQIQERLERTMRDYYQRKKEIER